MTVTRQTRRRMPGPLGAWVVTGALLLGAGQALAQAGATPVATAQPSVPTRALAMANGIRFDGPATAPVQGARNLFVVHCAGCHGFDGSGHPGQGVPDMRGALGHYLRLPEGRAFMVQVPGVNNAGLDDAQITLLSNWLVQQFSAATAPPGWTPYQVAEVRALRAQRPVDIGSRRAALLQALQAQGIRLY
jgi:mono/diheme cytochrome c family protein